MKLWLTAAEIADLALPGLPGTKRNVNAFAHISGWTRRDGLWRPRKAAGGGIEYHLDLLPPDARRAYVARLIPDVVPEAMAEAAEAEPAAPQMRDDAAEARDARLAILAAAERIFTSAKLPREHADLLTVADYAAGRLTLPPWVRAKVPALTLRSLKRWRAAARDGRTASLAVDRGAARRGLGVLDTAEGGQVRVYALALIARQPHLSADHVREMLRARFGETLSVIRSGGEVKAVPLPPIRTVQDALRRWRETERVALTAITNPDAYKSRFKLAGNNTATTVTRLNEVWQIDASPMDALCVNGRHSVYLAIDVWSRRVVVYVSKTPRAEAVGLLLRRAILAWGVPETVKSDNGSDFTAKASQRLLASLGIAHELSPAFTPEDKAFVERAVGTFQRDLGPILPGFIGHNHGHARPYLTLAMEMEERYMHYRSQLQVRRLAFDTIEPKVTTPQGVPAKIIDAVTELVNDPGFRAACSDLQDGVAKGYSVVEPIWDYERGMLRPVRYKHRDPRFFQFDRVTLEDLRLASDTSFDGTPIPRGLFLQHMPSILTGLPLRSGLARPVAWAWIVQSFTLQDWSAFAEIYGIPFRVGKYGAGASDADKRTLLHAVRAIANDAAAIIPMGMEIDFQAVQGSHGEAVFGNLLAYLDRQVSKVVLGQTMTADEGSSLGQAKIHNEVRIDIKRADAQQTGGTINRDLIPWFVAFNFGPQDVYPQVDFPVAEPEDIKAITDGVAKLVPLGLKVSQREMREKLALSEPEAGEDLLTAPAGPTTTPPAPEPGRTPAPPETLSLRPGHPGGCHCAGCAAVRLAATDPLRDAIDDLQDDQLSDWEAITDPLLEGVFALAADATSFDDVLARLDTLRTDSGPLRERLARASAIARGLGDVGA